MRKYVEHESYVYEEQMNELMDKAMEMKRIGKDNSNLMSKTDLKWLEDIMNRFIKKIKLAKN